MIVASETNRRAAAPRFVSPWAMSVEDLQLALAERLCAGLRSWVTSRVATDGASTTSPRAAARIARDELRRAARP